MEKEEKDIRFVARFYRENRLDTTQAWQKLGIGKQRNNSILLYRLITIAAVTFLIAGFSWWWIYDRQDWIVIASSAHAVKEVTLPDNSHITLAENSALQYDRLAYGKKNRNVTLNGKAYFSVTHQEQCPFRVQTELANIQVLGTQFQVTANANQTSATVESGKVRFYNKEQKEAILTKGMYAFINQKGQMQINKQSDPNTFAWKTHVFVYNEAPLKKVVKELEEVYKVHIGGIPQKEYYLTTTFDNTPIEDIIEIINQTLDTKQEPLCRPVWGICGKGKTHSEETKLRRTGQHSGCTSRSPFRGFGLGLWVLGYRPVWHSHSNSQAFSYSSSKRASSSISFSVKSMLSISSKVVPFSSASAFARLSAFSSTHAVNSSLSILSSFSISSSYS